MTRVCTGCGLMRCEGECYLESPAPDTCWKCRSNLVDGECPECAKYALRHGNLGLTEVHGDPMFDGVFSAIPYKCEYECGAGLWSIIRAAIATETRRAETTGSVEDEGAGPQDIAQRTGQ